MQRASAPAGDDDSRSQASVRRSKQEPTPAAETDWLGEDDAQSDQGRDWLQGEDQDENENEEVAEEEVKDEPRKPFVKREPFEVPTQGAFWLHDDRFDEAEQAAHEE